MYMHMCMCTCILPQAAEEARGRAEEQAKAAEAGRLQADAVTRGYRLRCIRLQVRFGTMRGLSFQRYGPKGGTMPSHRVAGSIA